ncbi:hypothetical protein KJY73_07995 [Bowmanella sp. Y26]|uniref:hypothetical protein n=1 Tax=Bowmanella yangjiangensis TaxID=2811230 RepID=UPI001BDC3E80|nr:hypothetical protein [Bowmanella yangjiangensis]MBT1063512.1 hypothetical protein [Bowmanella yangjiangensis]
MKNLSIILVFILLAGCSVVPKNGSNLVTEAKPILPKTKVEQRTMMLGKWYGDLPTKEGGRKQWTIERSTDGTYKIDFLITKIDGTTQKFSEAGHWGVAGDIYFSMYRGAIDNGQFYPSDPSDPYNYDAYNIIGLTSDSFEYQNIDSKNKYIVKKVQSNFSLGESEL